MSPQSKPANELKRSTLLSIMSVFAIGYFGAIWLLGQERAIEIGNTMLMSLACGIVVAYTPTASAIMRYRTLDGATVLCFGIWLGWASIAYRTGGVIIWRFVDKPDGWLDSAIWGLHILGTCCSAVCHALGPEAINGGVPTRQWIWVGLMVTTALLVFTLLAFFSGGL